MGQNKDKEKQIAEELFLSNKTLKEIAEIVQVNENTLGKWAQAGEWKKRKTDLQISPLKLKETLLVEAKKLAGGEATTLTNFDALSKCIAAIDRLDKKFRITPAVIQSVFKDFDIWLAAVDVAMAKDLLQYHKKYLQEKIKQEDV